MLLRELSLVNFRNYVRLVLNPGDPLTVLLGDNGQGKSNVLEAIYFLATTRSPRTSNDRELVHWRARRDVIPFARLEARIHRDDLDLHIEMLIKAETDAASLSESAADTGETVPTIRPVSKQVKVNGLPTRAVELIGQVNVVLFTPDDVALVAGSPSGRRRYLDITISQVDGHYLRALQRYNKVLAQRNTLLRQVRDRRQRRDALDFWNDELVRLGSYVVTRRLATIAAINGEIGGLYRELGGSQHELALAYHATTHAASDLAAADAAQLPGLYAAKVAELLPREIDQGVSLVGPHRDDFTFVVDGVDLHDYGSRGQQRLAVLALKLSEARFMRAQTEERPILLLDDILSELDPSRRGFVLAQAGTAGQTLITTTDLDDFGPDLRGRASVYRVQRGTLSQDAGDAPYSAGGLTNGAALEYGPPARRVAEAPLESPSGQF